MKHPWLSLLMLWAASGIAAEANWCERWIRAMAPKSPAGKLAMARLGENITNLLQYRRNFHDSPALSIGDPGQQVRIRVRKKIAAGMFGIVYHAEIAGFDPGAPAAHPRLFQNGTPRRDLVVKVPKEIVIPFTAGYFKKALREEYRDTVRINDKLVEMGMTPIGGAEVLSYGVERNGNPEFMIKPLVAAGWNTKGLAEKQSALDEEQASALRAIFDRAHALYYRCGISLDIKPENLVWDEKARDWKMYEVTDVALAGNEMIKDGFDGYLALVNEAIQHYRRLGR